MSGLILCCIAIAGCNSTDPQYSSLLQQQVKLAENALRAFQTTDYSAYGIWDPGVYLSDQPDGYWEKEQWPAITEAILSRLPNNPSSANEAQVAADTVNTAIAEHQLADGDFDAGPQGSEPSSVAGGTFWAEAEGLIANVLADSEAATRSMLQSWEHSMVTYTSWLESSGNAHWYVNGNVNLRMAVIFLETYKLAVRVGDPRAAYELAAYHAEQSFATKPGWAPSGAWGWHQYGAAGWFSETPPETGSGNFGCYDNLENPCVGLDWYYNTLQLTDALIGYVISDYDPWWQNVVQSEWTTERQRISGGFIDASAGSRHDDPSDLFDPSVYAVLDEHNLGRYDGLWSAQLSALQSEYKSAEKLGADQIAPNDYAFVAAPAIGILDAEVTR
jgi:hypothetical protein